MVKGFAATDERSALAPYSFSRRDPLATDIVVETLYCGVCHSDLHMARNEWKQSVYPLVPGHEIVGRVVSVGSAVKKFKPGILQLSVSSLTPVAIARHAAKVKSNIARMGPR